MTEQKPAKNTSDSRGDTDCASPTEVQPLNFGGNFLGGDFKTFDQFLDLVNEVGGAGAVNYAVIEGEREGNNFGGFVFFAVRNQFAMSGAYE
jgi:hypothetical protein